MTAPVRVGRPWVGLGVLVALGVVAAVVVRVTTPHGVAFAPDSAIYLGVAHNLLHGHGLTSPVTLAFTDYFPPATTVRYGGALPVVTLPPGYPLAVAAFGALGASLDTGARIVGALSLGAGAFLAGYVVLRTTRSASAAVGGVVVLLGAGALVEGFAPGSWVVLADYALAEVLFLPLVLGAVVALARLAERGRTVDAVLVGAVAGVAILVRFLGVALLLAALVLLLVRTAWPLRRRIVLGAVAVAIGMAPVAAWAIGMRVLVGHGEPSTPLRYHAYEAEMLGQGLRNAANWFVPADTSSPVAYAVLAAVGVALVAMAVVTRRRAAGAGADGEDATPDWTVAAMLAVAGSYLAGMAASHLAANGDVRFDIRFLAIVRPLVYLVALVVVFRFLRSFRLRAAGVVVLGVALVAAAPFAGELRDFVDRGAPRNAAVADGELFRAVRALPPGSRIFSDAPDTLWLATGRDAVLVPIEHVRESGLDNPRFRDDLAQLDALLAVPDSYLVMFHGVHPGVLATTDDIAATVPLEVVATFPQGTILRRAPAGSP